MDSDPNLLKQFVLISIWIEFLWQAYLNRRQYHKLLHTVKLPREIRNIMPQALFTISREYALACLEFHLARSVVIVVFSSIMIREDYIARIWSYAQSKNPYQNEVLTSCIWLCILNLLTTSVDIPFDMYYTFILERGLGLSVITLNDFLRALVIGLLVTQIMSMGFVGIVVTIIQHAGRYVFMTFWLLLSIILSASTNLASLLKSPLPNSLGEFPHGCFKTNIENLCAAVELSLDSVEMSLNNTPTGEHDSVFFYGLFSQHLVISAYIFPIPHLQNKLSEEDILALIAHQLGHWFNNHIIKKFILSQAFLLIWFFLFINIFERKVVYQAFGFHDVESVFVGIMLSMQYIMMPYNLITTFALISCSRRFEFEADDFATRLGMKQALRNALMGVFEVSIHHCPILDDLYSKCNFSQPSLLERVKNLNSADNF